MGIAAINSIARVGVLLCGGAGQFISGGDSLTEGAGVAVESVRVLISLLAGGEYFCAWGSLRLSRHMRC